MGLESIKFYVTVYIIFATLLSVLDIGAGINLGVPTPPAFTGVAILGEDLQTSISELRNMNIVFGFIGGMVEGLAILVSVIIYFIAWVFYLGFLFVFWTIPGQPIINMFLVLYRILMLFELIPYIKNAVHPLQSGSH